MAGRPEDSTVHHCLLPQLTGNTLSRTSCQLPLDPPHQTAVEGTGWWKLLVCASLSTNSCCQLATLPTIATASCSGGEATALRHSECDLWGALCETVNCHQCEKLTGSSSGSDKGQNTHRLTQDTQWEKGKLLFMKQQDSVPFRRPEATHVTKPLWETQALEGPGDVRDIRGGGLAFDLQWYTCCFL